MAKETLTILLKAQNEANKELRKLRGEIDNVKNTHRRATDSIWLWLKKLVPIVATVFAADRIIGFGKSIVQLWWQLEQTKVAFTTMLWSAERANKLLAELSDFAAKTPFEINWIRQTTKQLLAYGIEVEKIIPTLKSLGDVSAGLSVPIEQIAYAYWQVRSANQLLGTELRQFVNAGVPLIQELASMFGVTEWEIKKMTSQGLVSFEHVEQAFKNMSGEWWRFFDLMDKQSETLLWQWSNVQDSITRVKEELWQALLPTMKEVVGEIADRASEMANNKEKMDALKNTIEVTGEVIMFVGDGVVNFTAFLWKMWNTAREAAEALGAVVSGITWIGWATGQGVVLRNDASTNLMSPWARNEALTSYFNNWKTVQKDVVTEVKEAQKQISEIIGGWWWWGWGWKNAVSATENSMKTVLDENKDALEKIRDLRKNRMEDVKDAITNAYSRANDLIDTQKSKIRDGRKELDSLIASYDKLTVQTSLNIAGEVVNLQDQLKQVDQQIKDLKAWNGEWSYIDLLNQQKELQKQIWLWLENTDQQSIEEAKKRASESNIERILRESEEQRDLLREHIKEVKSRIEQEQQAYTQLYDFKSQLENSYHQLFKSHIQEQIGLYDRLLAKMSSASIGWGIAWARAMWWPVSGWQTYLVGERWPELFVPNRSWSIVPNNKITNNTPINITVNVSWNGNGQQIAQEIERMLTRKKQLSSLWIV